MKNTKKQQPNSTNPPKQEITQSKVPKPNIKLIFIAFFTGVISSIILQRYICQNWQQISPKIFSSIQIDDNLDKLNVLKESLIYMSLIELILALSIMSIRIMGQKISPVGQQDPLIIAVINRVLSNNIQQAVVFYSIFSYLLFNHSAIDLSPRYVLALPILFLVGRVVYGISYILGSMVNVSSTRSIGFAFVFTLGYLMIVEIAFERSSFMREFLFE